MPHEPTAPEGIRFFGRIDKFHCECPCCGCIIVARGDMKLRDQRAAAMHRREFTYNPITSLLYCPRCRRGFGVGLLLWSMSPGGVKKVPADQQPTLEQLYALRQYNVAIWGRRIRRSGDELNVVVDGECICPRAKGGFSQRCPVHGWLDYSCVDEAEREGRGEG